MPDDFAQPLSAADVSEYERNGLLLREKDILTEGEIQNLLAVIPEVLDTRGPEVVLERDGETVRSVYGVHRTFPAVRDLVVHPKLIGAVRQILGGDIYVHQSKINIKAAFSGDQWEWHQDYINWLRADGIPRPSLINVAIFLDEATEFNGPLMFIPGSQRMGLLPGADRAGMPASYEDAPSWVDTLTADEKFKVDRDTIRTLAEKDGLFSAKGGAGSALFFHSNILHASLPNISPFDRKVLILVYNLVDNAPGDVDTPRPDFLAERSPVALVPRNGEEVTHE
ncbi:phytanoyl-CoA dioxygenase family protein [Nocardia sp. CA-128927]|uniref:phytanoyl-CoA dioxygenase family protein n=1 Tax=Nocardia sp. CA-128927 TaxID=3239975 RepID=UPI003D98F5E7